ncbi:MerR family transcriptional regulator [Roseibium aggregatum]|uniref:MerR family transcriptional regulator n=1 Tax=Roseibium aggregatum TaxID=187304 RepID=UPI003A969258
MKGVDMQIKEAAERLGITERMLRHYEKSGLMETRRSENGYRSYSAADLRRAGRIRDFIATGFSTREVRAMAACLSDEGSGPCEGGIPQLLKKLKHIDRLSAELEAKREAILDRLAVLEDVFPVGAEEKDRAQARRDTPLSGRGPGTSGEHHTELEPHASGR